MSAKMQPRNAKGKAIVDKCDIGIHARNHYTGIQIRIFPVLYPASRRTSLSVIAA